MAQYHFQTTWRFSAPVERVWQAILDYEAYPSWWPAVAETAKLKDGDAQHVGETFRISFRTPLRYRLSFVMTTSRYEPPYELDGEASGELTGTGRWRLRSAGQGTVVQYFWDVSTSLWWMNLLAPIARPAFVWNHNRVMESGYRGLARLLARERVNGAMSEELVPEGERDETHPDEQDEQQP